jgi:hypothetical protein
MLSYNQYDVVDMASATNLDLPPFTSANWWNSPKNKDKTGSSRSINSFGSLGDALVLPSEPLDKCEIDDSDL